MIEQINHKLPPRPYKLNPTSKIAISSSNPDRQMTAISWPLAFLRRNNRGGLWQEAEAERAGGGAGVLSAGKYILRVFSF